MACVTLDLFLQAQQLGRSQTAHLYKTMKPVTIICGSNMDTNGGLTLYVEIHVSAEIQNFTTSQLLKCFYEKIILKLILRIIRCDDVN
jgi:hypothetical protein